MSLYLVSIEGVFWKDNCFQLAPESELERVKRVKRVIRVIKTSSLNRDPRLSSTIQNTDSWTGLKMNAVRFPSPVRGTVLRSYLKESLFDAIDVQITLLKATIKLGNDFLIDQMCKITICICLLALIFFQLAPTCIYWTLAVACVALIATPYLVHHSVIGPDCKTALTDLQQWKRTASRRASQGKFALFQGLDLPHPDDTPIYCRDRAIVVNGKVEKLGDLFPSLSNQDKKEKYCQQTLKFLADTLPNHTPELESLQKNIIDFSGYMEAKENQGYRI